MAAGESHEAQIAFDDGAVELHRSNRKWGDMPAVYSSVPPLVPGKQTPLMNVWLGIYHIYPHRSIENCFDVIYAPDDKGTLQIGSFMNTLESSITEGYIFTKVLQGIHALTGTHLFCVDPSTFWNILLHWEAYLAMEEYGFMVLPHFDCAPAKNRALLKKAHDGQI